MYLSASVREAGSPDAHCSKYFFLTPLEREIVSSPQTLIFSYMIMFLFIEFALILVLMVKATSFAMSSLEVEGVS